MESIAAPLRLLWDDASWFARAHELRFWWVGTDTALRKQVLELVLGQEFHADNTSLFFQFQEPASGKDLGFSSRAARLVDQFEQARLALAAAGTPIAELAAVPTNLTPLAEFALRLKGVRDALRPPLDGVVVVLAPVSSADTPRFGHDLRALLASKELAGVRFVVVETEGSELVRAPGDLAIPTLVTSCRVDVPEQRRELRELLGPAPPKDFVQSPPRYRCGGAAPPVAPPPRKGEPAPLGDAQLRELGVNPLFVNGGGEQLSALLLAGALKLSEERPAEAIELQTRAVELCVRLELVEQEVVQLLVLSSYLLAGSLKDQARVVSERAAKRASEAKLPALGCQAELALAAITALHHKRTPGRHYEAAARLAEDAKQPTLALECWRMAGQKALEIGVERKAVHCFKRALALSGAMDPTLARSTSAADVARALALLYQGREEAKALERLAAELEREPVADRTLTVL